MQSPWMHPPAASHLLQHVGHAGENTDQRTSEILDDAHQFVVQLADIYDYVSPCFPEKYQIFNVIWQEYHQSMAFMLDCVGACSEQLANGDILKASLAVGCRRLQKLFILQLASGLVQQHQP